MTSNTPWLQQLASAPLSERSAMLEVLVIAEFRELLLMNEAELFPLDESYFALGLTSIGATEIQGRLETVFGRRIDSSSLFNNPTAGHLLDYLRGEVLGDLFASAPASIAGSAGGSGAGSADTAASAADALQLDPAQDAPSAEPSAQRASPKDLLDNLLDELYAS